MLSWGGGVVGVQNRGVEPPRDKVGAIAMGPCMVGQQRGTWYAATYHMIEVSSSSLGRSMTPTRTPTYYEKRPSYKGKTRVDDAQVHHAINGTREIEVGCVPNPCAMDCHQAMVPSSRVAYRFAWHVETPGHIMNVFFEVTLAPLPRKHHDSVKIKKHSAYPKPRSGSSDSAPMTYTPKQHQRPPNYQLLVVHILSLSF